MDKYNFALLNDFHEWLQIFEIVEQRRKIGSINSMDFIIHSNEQGHNKAHLHVSYKEKEAVIEIPSGEILKSDLSGKQNMLASHWVRQHGKILTEQWNTLTNGVRIPVI